MRQKIALLSGKGAKEIERQQKQTSEGEQERKEEVERERERERTAALFTVSSRRYPRKKSINRNARAENGPQLEVKKGTRHREGERAR